MGIKDTDRNPQVDASENALDPIQASIDFYQRYFPTRNWESNDYHDRPNVRTDDYVYFQIAASLLDSSISGFGDPDITETGVPMTPIKARISPLTTLAAITELAILGTAVGLNGKDPALLESREIIRSGMENIQSALPHLQLAA